MFTNELPSAAWFRIFSFLPHKDLANITKVNQKFHEMTNDFRLDGLKQKLTKDELATLQNEYQLKALLVLEQHGFPAQTMIQYVVNQCPIDTLTKIPNCGFLFPGSFVINKCQINTSGQVAILSDLLKQGMDPVTALLQISGQNESQPDKIQEGVFITAASTPSNDDQSEASSIINSESSDYLSCSELPKGLSIVEALKLNNSFQVEAIKILNSYGLTSQQALELLEQKVWFNTGNHVEALEYLLTTQHMEPDAAIQTLKGLSKLQLQGISDGLSRTESLNLKNQFQLESINNIKSKQFMYGLPPSIDQKTLVELITKNDWFNTSSHIEALDYLVKQRMELDAAIQKLEGLNQEKLMNIVFLHDIPVPMPSTNMFFQPLNQQQNPNNDTIIQPTEGGSHLLRHPPKSEQH